MGDDVLFGGESADTYVFNTGDGVDTIYDDAGSIIWEDITFTGEAEYESGNIWSLFAGGAEFTLTDTGANLEIISSLHTSDKIIIRDYGSSFGG